MITLVGGYDIWEKNEREDKGDLISTVLEPHFYDGVGNDREWESIKMQLEYLFPLRRYQPRTLKAILA